jgi:hypothetical protein
MTPNPDPDSRNDIHRSHGDATEALTATRDSDAHASLTDDVGGMELSRLLSVATLTTPQATYLAWRVCTLSELHRSVRPSGHTVFIDDQGEVQLRLEPVARHWPDQSAPPPVGPLLRELARNADRPAARRGPNAALLDALWLGAEQMNSESDDRVFATVVSSLRRALDAAVGTDDRTLRAELAALSAHAARLVPSYPDRSSSSATRGDPLRSHEPSDVAPPRGRRINWRTGVIAASVAAILVAGALLVMDRTSGRHPPAAEALPTASKQPAPRVSSTRPVRVGTAGLPRVPRLAAAAAGDVRGVSLQPQSSCTPGTTCAVTVKVNLTPSTTTRDISWQFEVINRCTGKITGLTGGVLTAQPGWDAPYATTSLQLPAGRALAVVAKTTAPSQAASKPLLAPAGGGSCA